MQHNLQQLPQLCSDCPLTHTSVLQAQGPSQIMTGGAAGDCHTYCHPKERALYRLVPQDPEYPAYSPESLAGDLDIEP